MHVEPTPQATFKASDVSTLTLKGLRCQAKIGWTDAERSNPQPIEVDLCIRFSEIPPACFSDNLDHAICYADLSKVIQTRASEDSYKLLERMAYKLHQAIQLRVPSRSHCWVRVTKLNPPVPNLHGHTRFAYGDFNPEGL